MSDKNYSEKIDLFYGGISDDIRIQKPEVFAISQHFDIWTNPKRLVPHRAMEADENKTFMIVNFAYGLSTLYGLGIKTGGGNEAKIFSKATDPITGSWAAVTSAEDSAGTREPEAFQFYHDVLYGGASGTARIWAFAISGATFTSSAYTGAGTPTAQGIITSDDLLLIPCASNLARKNGAGSGVTDAWSIGLALPSYMRMVDLCEIGDFVAVACRPVATTAGNINSKVYLWDKVSADPTSVIDWGEGYIALIDNIDGELVGISQLAHPLVPGIVIKDKLQIRAWSGGSKARPVFEIESDDNTLTIGKNHTKIKEGSKFSFGLKIKLEGTTYNQMATIGRKKEGYPLAFTLDRLVDNDTAITSIDGAFKLGSYHFVAHNGDGSVNRTHDTAVYTDATSLIITQKLTGESKVAGAHRMDKQLLMAGVLCKPIVSGESISLYYRKDEASSWTLIRTLTTTSALGFEAGIANDSTDFGNYKELQFKALSLGGAQITGIIWAWKFAGAGIASE